MARPPSAGAAARPRSVRALSALLLLELAVMVVLVALALLAAAVTVARRSSADWSDLAIAVTLLLAAAGAGLAVLYLLAWLALRARRPWTLPLTVIAQLAPLIGLGLLPSMDARAATLAVAAALAMAGIVLALAPATRCWCQPAAA